MFVFLPYQYLYMPFSKSNRPLFVNIESQTTTNKIELQPPLPPTNTYIYNPNMLTFRPAVPEQPFMPNQPEISSIPNAPNLLNEPDLMLTVIPTFYSFQPTKRLDEKGKKSISTNNLKQNIYLKRSRILYVEINLDG